MLGGKEGKGAPSGPFCRKVSSPPPDGDLRHRGSNALNTCSDIVLACFLAPVRRFQENHAERSVRISWYPLPRACAPTRSRSLSHSTPPVPHLSRQNCNVSDIRRDPFESTQAWPVSNTSDIFLPSTFHPSLVTDDARARRISFRAQNIFHPLTPLAPPTLACFRWPRASCAFD